MQPETVAKWHRQGFRLYWRWRSSSKAGRPTVGREVRDLIRRMSHANPEYNKTGAICKEIYSVAKSRIEWRYRPRFYVNTQFVHLFQNDNVARLTRQVSAERVISAVPASRRKPKK